jgi:DNA polymerase-1
MLPAWDTPRARVLGSIEAVEAWIAEVRASAPAAIAVHPLVPATQNLPDRKSAFLPPAALAIATSREDVVVIEDVAAAAEALGVWLGGRAPDGLPGETTKPPYVVVADAQALLRRTAALGLVPSRIGCIATAVTLLAEGTDARASAHDLAALVRAYLQAEIEAAFVRDDHRFVREVSTLLSLMPLLVGKLREQGLTRVFELECRLAGPVVDMELAGFAVDVAAWERIATGWANERATTQEPDRIARLDKLLSTYRGWGRDYTDLDGRMRCLLHPLAADSGRFACSSPNLQQVPSEHTAPGLRRCFVAAEGHTLVVADYAQIELRVAARVAGCAAMRDVFVHGRDPHRATAATLTGKPEAAIDDHERKLAKAINFGFLFGMGAERFREYAASSYGLTLDVAAAKRAREAFLDTYPGIAAWHRRTARLADRGRHEDVVVSTLIGRKKRFRAGKFSFTAALNIPVQGTAADGFKAAMIRLHERLPRWGARGILVVHDEYVAEVPNTHAEEVRALVADTMREAMEEVLGDVPILVEAALVDSWGEA